MSHDSKVTAEHLRRAAYLYVRQSSLQQVHDHRESTARQYALQRRAQTLGWPHAQIVVIDEDLGLSGAAAVARPGFQRLVADVGLGRVGLVMGLEVSRLARNSTDWHRLLEICALAETLILDEDGLYDPSHFNDRLLLGLKGTMSEAELHVLRARLLGGQLNKARRGELWMSAPLGFVHDAHQHLVLDPDAQIQASVRLLFETFRRTGSACQVVRHFAREGLRFPRRLRTGPRAGEVVFGLLGHHRVLQILHNPRYAGAFVYGRTRQRHVVIGGQVRYRRLPRPEWRVFLPNTHPGYLSWEDFETNQATLKTNAAGYGTDRRRSPPREGTALLQGLALCGRCGDRMAVHYVMRQGHPAPDYVCQRRGVERAEPRCQSIPGTGLDEAVSAVVLEAVSPAAIAVAFEVYAELRARQAEVDRLRRARVARAREAAELAQRQFLCVRPEHRLVADELERQWNAQLAALAEAEEEYRRTAAQDGCRALDDEAKAKIHTLAADLPRVWRDPRTPARDRKRMLRLLLEDVTLTRGEMLRIELRWKGGATTALERPLPQGAPDLRRTPATIVEIVRALATEQTDGQIAAALNDRWLRTGTGQPFTRLRVRHIRETYEIASLTDRLRADGWLTTAEVATQLHLHRSTAKRFALEGVLRAVRADDRGGILIAPLAGLVPAAHPGKRFRDRRQYPKLAPHVRQEVQCGA
jgi:DNA invertase Pin-like site-specific DNA recombinase